MPPIINSLMTKLNEKSLISQTSREAKMAIYAFISFTFFCCVIKFNYIPLKIKAKRRVFRLTKSQGLLKIIYYNIYIIKFIKLFKLFPNWYSAFSCLRSSNFSFTFFSFISFFMILSLSLNFSPSFLYFLSLSSSFWKFFFLAF